MADDLKVAHCGGLTNRGEITVAPWPWWHLVFSLKAGP